MKHRTDWPGTAEMIRRVSTVKGREATGLFSIEGTRLLERALRAGVQVETILMSESYVARADSRTERLQDDGLAGGAIIIVAPDTVVDELTEGRNLGAVLGLVRRPTAPRLEDLAGGLFLAGVDIIDPGNAGALVRTAHAAGATAFLAAGSTDPFHPRAIRISRGSIFRLPVIHFANAAELLHTLKAQAMRTIATAAGGGQSLPDLAPSWKATAVLMGNEGEGLPAEVQRAADLIVTIPMPDGVDSFAVNAAAAIVLYELQRPMWQQGHRA